MIKGRGQRLIPEELLKYLQEVKNTYPEALEIVSANPTLSGDESALESIEIKGVKYSVGGSSGLYMHVINCSVASSYEIMITLYSAESESYTYNSIKAKNLGAVQITGSSENYNKVVVGGYIGTNIFQFYNSDGSVSSVESNTLFTDYVTKIL